MSPVMKFAMVILVMLIIFCALLSVYFQLKPSLSAPTPITAQQLNAPVPLYKDISKISFTDSSGVIANPVFEDGQPVVLLYWASWCNACKSILPQIDQFAVIVEKSGAKFYLVNRLEESRETYQTANDTLSALNITTPTLFDENRKGYDSLGLSMIPSLVVANGSGIVTSCELGQLPSTERILSMIREANLGKSAFLSEFIQNQLLLDSGGVRTGYLPTKEKTPGATDVLSESQGLMMLCAQLIGDDSLFDRLWGYMKQHRAGDSLAAWVTTEEGPSPINAIIDDFRIVRALSAAQIKRNIFQNDLKEYAASIYKYSTQSGNLVDFYDFGSSQKAKRLTLCYADFEALEQLSNYDKRFSKISQRALKIVQDGYISDSFPFYYSWFDYTTETYAQDDLNMAEALTTLLNLSKVGLLPPQSLEWISTKLAEGQIWAGYHVDGSPMKQSRYESTAIYALVAQIAINVGNRTLAEQAINKMDLFKLYTDGKPIDGAFGNQDGTGIYSFDQCKALLAYLQMEQT